jgi:Mg2+/Co2+ transporter CorB
LQDLATPTLLWLLLTTLTMVAFSSGTEVAMLSANRYRVRSQAAAGDRRARMLENLLSRPDDWLGANLLVLTLASAGATTIATILAVRTGHRYALLFPTLILPTLMLVFCELAPKIYSASRPDGVARFAAPLYRAVVWLARPGVIVANAAAYGFLRLFGIVRDARRGDQQLSPEELRVVVNESAPMVPQRHRQMLLSILDLERITVNDIMIPRQDIAGIDLEDDWERILEQLRQTPHTRLPVYRGDLGDMVGLLHMKRAAQELARGSLDRDRLEEVARQREPYYVPEGTPLTVQLANFQRDRRRLAFVVDEYGDVLGIVTLEDILEEIVGEFTSDPGTMTQRDVHRETSGALIINAGSSIRDLNRRLGWSLPTDGPKTLNGLLLERLENIPAAGTVLRIDGMQFEVLQIADNTVRTVRVRELKPAADSAEGGSEGVGEP